MLSDSERAVLREMQQRRQLRPNDLMVALTIARGCEMDFGEVCAKMIAATEDLFINERMGAPFREGVPQR